jgi:hypothetical protein
MAVDGLPLLRLRRPSAPPQRRKRSARSPNLPDWSERWERARLPTTSAASAPARKVSCLARMLPDTRSGTTTMSARPATAEVSPFSLAASGLMALSKASGPSSRAPVIWPRSAILPGRRR